MYVKEKAYGAPSTEYNSHKLLEEGLSRMEGLANVLRVGVGIYDWFLLPIER